MPDASPGAPPGHVFYGWTVVTAAGLVLFLFGLAGSMAAVGPLIAGFIYDRAGDYQLA